VELVDLGELRLLERHLLRRLIVGWLKRYQCGSEDHFSALVNFVCHKCFVAWLANKNFVVRRIGLHVTQLWLILRFNMSAVIVDAIAIVVSGV
jgi:hypothetical protein